MQRLRLTAYSQRRLGVRGEREAGLYARGAPAGNQYLDAAEADALARQAQDAATQYRAHVAAARGKKRKDLLDHFLDDARWALRQCCVAVNDVDA